MTRFAAAILLLFTLPFAAAPVIELPQQPVLRFIVTGDAGASHSAIREGMLAVSRRTHLDGILLVGDNFYPCGVSGLSDPQWTKITEHFGPTHLPIYPILGNHDYGDQQEHRDGSYSACGNPDAGSEIKATGKVRDWHFPARHYVMHSPLAEFVMLDTQPVALAFAKPVSGSSTAAEEVAWLTGTLDKPSTARWRIVAGHHTIYSSGMHGRTNDPTQQRMRALLPLLRNDHVDLYICGHDHDLELIGDLHPSGEPLFLISGAGSGTDVMKPRKAAGEPPTIWSPLPGKPTLGFAVLEIASNELSITFYDKAGTQTAGPFTTRK